MQQNVKQLQHNQQTPLQNPFFQLKKQIQNIHNNIAQVKNASNTRRNQRQQKINQFQHQKNKKQAEFQEELKKHIESPPPPSYRLEFLGGLVVQVPENHQLHKPQNSPYSSQNSIYYVSEVLKNFRDKKSAVREHLQSSVQILKALQKSKMGTKAQIQEKILKLPVSEDCRGLKTIVFDLDETLIHCNQSLQMPYDIKITIKFPTGETTEAGVNIRPGAIELLNLLKGKFEVIIFTASHSCYANQILDNLDPKKQLIHHRLYREHCHISNEGYYIKDLRILGKQMKNMLLVDNAAYSYAYQLDNGVPILPYFTGKNDFQLKALGEYLMGLRGQKQLRSSNHKLFKLNRYVQFSGRIESMVQDLYIAENIE